MRTYGRLTDEFGDKAWVEVTTDASGANDYVWLTTLIQCLKLSIGESPFFANYGIPAQQSVIQQIFPDFYVTQTQTQFSGYFASLIVAKLSGRSPEYRVSVTTNQGVQMAASIPA